MGALGRWSLPSVVLLLAVGGCGLEAPVQTGLCGESAGAAPTTVLAQAATGAVLWSQFKPVGFKPGDDVTIAEGQSVIFDGDQADAIGKLAVYGTFVCAAGARTLEAKAILVAGPTASFTCGTAATPRSEPFTIHLSGQLSFTEAEMMPKGCPMAPAEEPTMSPVYQGLVVTCGATLELNGTAPNKPWLRLNATANAGATELSLPSGADCATWSAGKAVVVASSSFDQTQAEQRTIGACRSAGGVTTLTLTQALGFRHYGGASTTYDAGTTSLTLTNQAEVALLHRPILFQGTELTDAASKAALQDKRAAVMMFMMAPGHIRLTGVEFETVGRMGELGRYPAHWHKVGDHLAPGGTVYDAYIQKSVIHHSFNRCITVHETNGVLVQNNVCFDHFGHGYFLEEGNEVNNTFDRNLGLGSKAVPSGRQLLTTDRTSDNQSRYAAPATFWVSNPANTLTNNVAAGSAGSGFWFALKDSAHQPDGVATAPVSTALKQFQNNLAHSSRQGLTVDGAPNGACANNPLNDCSNPAFDVDTADFLTAQTVYAPPAPASFRGFTAYKCREYGLWFNATGNNVVREGLFADNQISVALVFDSVLRNSVVVAKTDNFDPASEVPKTARDFASKQFAATLVYDGPAFLDNVRLENFAQPLSTVDPATGTAYTYSPQLFSLTIAASNRSPAHRVRALSFGPTPPAIIADFTHDLGHPSKDNWAAGVVDLDGSLTGRAGSTLVPSEAMSNTTGCVTDARFAKSLICPDRFGLVFLANGGLQFDLVRKDTGTGTVGATYLLPTPPDPAHADVVPGAPYVDHQFSFPFSRVTQDTYVIQLRAPATAPTSATNPTPLSLSDLSNATTVTLYWADAGQRSPPLELYQRFRNCKILNPASLTDVAITQGDADVIQFQLTANTPSPRGWASGTYGGQSYAGQKYQSVSVPVRCYVPTSVAWLSPTTLKSGGWYPQNGEVVGYGASLFEGHVSGTSVKLTYGAGPNRGVAKVTVDDQPPLTIDLYAGSYVPAEVTLATGLPSGEHRVVVEYTGQKNALSKGTYLVLSALTGT